MRAGIQNPRHRRIALLQLALCTIGVLHAIYILALNGNSGLPSISDVFSSKSQTAHLMAAWLITVIQFGFQCWASWRYFKSPESYRTAFIFSSILALAAYPIGTAIGLYSLWILLRVPLVPAHYK